MKLIQFLFVVAVPLVLVGGALLTLFLVGALLHAVEDPSNLRRAIESAFRRPPRPARTPGPDHFYKPYWKETEKSQS
jgi:hypothetical protein